MRIETIPVQNPRVMLFSHDTFGLGHLRRCSNIARECARAIEDVSILYVTGATRPHRFGLPSCCDVVKLPALTKSPLGGYEPRNLDVSTDMVLSLRRGLILEAVRRFAPHVLLVDHAPLGAAGELRSALEWLRNNRPGTRIVLGMRDILDDPEKVSSEFGTETLGEILRHHYHDVLVYGDPRIFDPVREYGLPDAIADRVHPVGYVCRVPAPSPRAPGKTPRILVHAGGGQDGGPLYEAVLHAFAEDLRDLDADLDIVIGPYLPSRNRRWVESRAAGDPRIRASGFRSDLTQILGRADLVISMAGANTVAEILASGVPSILAPRRHPRREQWFRAKRLEELGYARCVDVERNDAPVALARCVRQALSGRLLPAVRPRPDCGGARSAARFLAGALTPRASADAPTDSDSPEVRHG